jgi:hypothetical protein
MASLRVPHVHRLEQDHPRLRTARIGAWTLCGGLVGLYIFFVVLGGVSPSEAKTATVVVVVLALMWLVHSWRRIWAEGNVSPHRDRERRGF